VTPHAASGLEALRAVLDRVAAVRPALRAVLEHALPVEVNAARLTLLFSDDESHSFLAAQAQEPGAVAVLTEAARGYFGAATAVEVKTGASRQAHGVATLASVDAEARKAASDRAREATLQHPIVAAAVRIFGAEVREVRPATTEE
jgi:hypothetical protein